MPFIHPYKIIFLFFLFSYYNQVYSKYCQCYKKITVNELRDFIYECYYQRVGFNKENSR